MMHNLCRNYNNLRDTRITMFQSILNVMYAFDVASGQNTQISNGHIATQFPIL